MEFEFERKAMKNEPCPKGLDVVDTAIYMALRYLYAMYKRGLISREKATAEKETIVFNWKTDKSKLEFLNRETKALREKIGGASAEYAKNPTIENAERLYCALYNLPENWREKQNLIIRKENGNE